MVEPNYYSPILTVLTYEIEAEDIYKDFWNDKDMFDNSDYQRTHHTIVTPIRK